MPSEIKAKARTNSIAPINPPAVLTSQDLKSIQPAFDPVVMDIYILYIISSSEGIGIGMSSIITNI